MARTFSLASVRRTIDKISCEICPALRFLNESVPAGHNTVRWVRGQKVVRVNNLYVSKDEDIEKMVQALRDQGLFATAFSTVGGAPFLLVSAG